MYKIRISRHNGITSTFNGILSDGQIRDCAASIPEEHYRAIEQAAHASENLEGTLEIDGVFYGWMLEPLPNVVIKGDRVLWDGAHQNTVTELMQNAGLSSVKLYDGEQVRDYCEVAIVDSIAQVVP